MCSVRFTFIKLGMSQDYIIEIPSSKSISNMKILVTAKKANIYHNFPIKRYEKVRNILFAIVYKHNIYADLGCFLHFLEFHQVSCQIDKLLPKKREKKILNGLTYNSVTFFAYISVIHMVEQSSDTLPLTNSISSKPFIKCV